MRLKGGGQTNLRGISRKDRPNVDVTYNHVNELVSGSFSETIDVDDARYDRHTGAVYFYAGNISLTGMVSPTIRNLNPELATIGGDGAVTRLQGGVCNVVVHVGVMPYTAWEKAFDPLLTPGARNYWKSHNFSAMSDAALDTIIDYAGKLPSDQTEIFIGLLGGETSRIAVDATAYAQRDAQFVLNVHARWESATDDQRCIAWAREFFDASAPYATGGVYINFMTEEEGDRVAAAYGAGYQRLIQLKEKYDPGNLFRLNQNIKPVA